MARKRTYKVFYSFLGGGDDVSSDEPVSMSLKDVCSKLFPRLKNHKDFLGVVDRHGSCFQIRIYGGYLLDVPLPERNGSLELTVDEAEALRRLSSLPDEITSDAFPDFEFQPWTAPEPKPWWRFW